MPKEVMKAAETLGLSPRCHVRTSRHLALLKKIMVPATDRLIEILASSKWSIHLDDVDAGELARSFWHHWELLFSKGIDEDYIAHVTRIGIIHRERGILPKIYIQAYGWITARLVEDVARAPGLDASERADLLADVTRLIFFDMAMAIGAYDVALID